ncbi:hypothetical protein LCGC14_1903630 [marine sediment metagenome]|uniref:Uncharacterized protein n=1 Tax=marine sediment metagenome TaxID=412755 RepID=A0A0F9GJ30_9ZZZZ
MNNQPSKIQKVSFYDKTYIKSDGSISTYKCKHNYQISGIGRGRKSEIISEETKNKIIKMRNDRYKYKQISEETKISYYHIKRILDNSQN